MSMIPNVGSADIEDTQTTIDYIRELLADGCKVELHAEGGATVTWPDGGTRRFLGRSWRRAFSIMRVGE